MHKCGSHYRNESGMGAHRKAAFVLKREIYLQRSFCGSLGLGFPMTRRHFYCRKMSPFKPVLWKHVGMRFDELLESSINEPNLVPICTNANPNYFPSSPQNELGFLPGLLLPCPLPPHVCRTCFQSRQGWACLSGVLLAEAIVHMDGLSSWDKDFPEQ